jgi:hypothetical protein
MFRQRKNGSIAQIKPDSARPQREGSISIDTIVDTLEKIAPLEIGVSDCFNLVALTGIEPVF